jgi:hypothetical protein
MGANIRDGIVFSGDIEKDDWVLVDLNKQPLPRRNITGIGDGDELAFFGLESFIVIHWR